MANYFTTSTLIADVVRRALIPTGQQTFQNADFIAFANEEMSMGCIPHVISHHEEYFVYTQFVPLNPNQSRYQIPTRAIGTKLRNVSYQDLSGNIFDMSRVKVDDLPSYQNNVIQNSFTLFYIEGNYLSLIPVVGANPVGYLRFSYYLRPNELVLENEVAMVTNIDFVNNIVTVNAIPTTFSLSTPLDIVQTENPFGTLRMDVIPTGINTVTNAITFAQYAIPPNLVIGDHIALAQQTIVPQIPSDLHSMLSQRVAARCLEALGDAQGLQLANAKLTEMEQKTSELIENRVEGTALKVVNKHSSLKRKKLYWRS